MKPLLSFVLLLAGFLLASSSIALHGEDWTTTDGKVYHGVAVVKAEPDAVTILHHDGGALVPLAKLSPDLQKRFNYDPAKAKVAAEARAQAVAENAKHLQAEMDLAQLQKQAALVATDPRVQNGTITLASMAADDTSTPTASVSTPTGPTDATHHTMDQLVDITKRLRDDHPDDAHHSIAFLKLVAHDLGPDLSDPAHHTLSSLVSAAHSLGPDPNDPTHHSRDQIFGTDPLSRP